MENLGKVAEMSAGIVDIVQPTELAKNFKSIISNDIIATKVSVKLILHPQLYFKNENTDKNIVFKVTPT